MQHPNIDLVQRLYGAYLGGDRETVVAAMDPSIRWHNSGYDATSGTLEGPDAVLQYLMGENHLEDYDLTVVDMLASDTRVAVVARTTGRIVDTRIVNDFVQLVRIADGRIAEVHNYNWDQRALAEAFPEATSVSA
ncbi:MAG: nuclear transport factor 2 family protein [Candidatus Limnocylindrales bacterium]